MLSPYPTGTKDAKTLKGKGMTVAVRYGLCKRDPDDDVVVFNGQDGGRPSSSSGPGAAAVEDSQEDDM
jgi:hypothetical protein